MKYIKQIVIIIVLLVVAWILWNLVKSLIGVTQRNTQTTDQLTAPTDTVATTTQDTN